MQRQRSRLDLFPETIDLNQRSIPNNNANRDNIHPLSWCENSINQVEARFPNYMRVTGEDQSINPVITTDDSAPSFGGWDRGESSSSGFNQRDESRNEISKSRLGWSSSSSYNPSSPSENWFFEPFNSPSSTSYHGTVRSQSSQSYYSANRGPSNITRNLGNVRESDDSQGHVLGAVLPHSIYKSGRHEIEQPPSFYPSSSSNLGNCNNIVEHDDASGSGFAVWGGSSCKRKAAEGTSASSSSNQLTGKNVMQHHGTSCYNSPGNLFISSGPLNPSLISHSEPQNSSNRFDVIPPPPLNFSTRSNLGQHETVSDAYAVSSSLRSFGVNRVQEHFSRPTSASSASRTLRIDPNNSLSQARPTRERTHSSPSPWNGSLSSQHGGSSSSSHLNEEADHTGRSRRDNLHYPTNVSDADTRNSVLTERIDWSFVPEMPPSSSSRNRSYGSPNGSISNSVRPSSSAWLPHHYYRHHRHQTSQNHHQRFSEAAPWIQYHNNSSNNRTSHFGLVPSASSPSDEAGSSNNARRQLDQRSAAALLMDISRNDADGWDAVTTVEERQRLIRQVLNAMRREVYLRAEDYMMFDPYMDEYAELHDRHRDMRLDVDNMSYEELLALEERIGNVSTGLSEEKITGSLKQRKHNSLETTQTSEPCCICQEDFLAGDAVGILDCAHEFHTSCIKQWLTQKNLCPICKMTALEKLDE